MSKEQKCKCCQDYWYTSNLTNGLCTNCYDYVADLETKLAGLQQENKQLKQQLAEKENTITNLIEDSKASKDWYKKQLVEKEKEVANKVIERVKELSVFDFKTYEEEDFRRYIICDMALDNIKKEYGD